MVNTFPQVVTIAGNDSDGSAGGPADLHAFFQRQVYGMLILTSAVAGNSYGIQDTMVMPAEFIAAQFDSLAADFNIRAVKTGMLADAKTIHTVAEKLSAVDFGHFVLDPVISTKHGARLLELNALTTLKEELIPLAELITPNFYEQEILAGQKINNEADVLAAAHKIQALGVPNVLMKGRHDLVQQKEVRDLLLTASGEGIWLTAPYVATKHINGTGDTLSAIIVAELAKGQTLETALKRAKRLTRQAIANEIEVGHQFGPINQWRLDD